MFLGPFGLRNLLKEVLTHFLPCMTFSEDAVPVVNTVSVDFKINMHTASGLRIDSLQVHNEPYKPYKVSLLTE